MRVRPRFLPLCLLPVVLGGCASSAPESSPEATGHTQQALGGVEGMFEYALDAPWRIEPVLDSSGNASYGKVPLQVSIHDGDLTGADRGSYWSDGTLRKLGNFCELSVEEMKGGSRVRTHISYSKLTEIESTTGPWRPDGSTPPHQVCKPSATNTCAALQNVGPTSEWHAGAWYQPQNAPTPGMDLPLVLTAKISRDASTSCNDTDPNKFYTLTNHVRVHFGEAPLPRFDNGWLYGDLHYHSQGTDNEGESGYHYRGVVRALGALGVDFAFATDHASASEQIVDVDMSFELPNHIVATSTGNVLRDTNAARFKMLRDEIWKSGGVNADALLGPNGNYPQGYLSHKVVPRVFLGGEVDTIPEIGKGWDGEGYLFGNGLYFDARKNFCGGWLDKSITVDGSCDPNKTTFDGGDALLFRDVQGIHDYGFSRSHMVMLPKSSSNVDGFVGSFTGKYGGGGRRLTKWFSGKAPLLPEIESKGYTFIAHPVPIGGCDTKLVGAARPNGAGLTSDPSGGQGPDMAPWTDTMLAAALSSQGVLGLELWNEDSRLCTSIGKGDAAEVGYESQSWRPEEELDDPIRKYERKGLSTGKFELQPFHDKDTGGYQYASTGVEWMLHHGTALWDQLLLKGMDPTITGSIPWVPAGEPRRMFIAGGSDAHGDFNYRREGYMTGTTAINDTAIAKVRNLLGVGAPADPIVVAQPFPGTIKTMAFAGTAAATTGTLTLDPGLVLETPKPHTQEQIVDTLKSGNFSVTDGPALRLVIDRNRNGIVDDGDTPMGGIVELYGEETLPVLVEWQSTPEFGMVNDVQLYVGVQAGDGVDDRAARTYAVQGHGTQSVGIASSAVTSTYVNGGRTYSQMKDGYWIDPTGALRPTVFYGWSGKRSIELPISAFQAGVGRRPERMYIRAFAQTGPKDAAACSTADGKLKGACIKRYAYTNPVWTIDGPRTAGTCPTGRPRALDRDGDGLPDGCDPCPTSKNNAFCPVVVGPISLSMKSL